jgi:hypothetical protein
VNAEQRKHLRAALAQAERETGMSRYDLWLSFQRADAFLRQDPARFCAMVAAQFAAEHAGKLGAREEFLSHVVAGLGLPLDARLAAVLTARASELIAAAQQQATADQATREAGETAAQSVQEFARERPRFAELRGEIYRLMREADGVGRELPLEEAYALAATEDDPDEATKQRSAA